MLVRNPLDNIISIQNMHQKQGIPLFSNSEYVNYWCKTYENLYQILNSKKSSFSILVKYEELTSEPKKSKPKDYKWEWLKDDGGDIIKSLKVKKVDKDYSKHKNLFNELTSSDQVKALLKIYDLNLPIIK